MNLPQEDCNLLVNIAGMLPISIGLNKKETRILALITVGFSKDDIYKIENLTNSAFNNILYRIRRKVSLSDLRVNTATFYQTVYLYTKDHSLKDVLHNPEKRAELLNIYDQMDHYNNI